MVDTAQIEISVVNAVRSIGGRVVDFGPRALLWAPPHCIVPLSKTLYPTAYMPEKLLTGTLKHQHKPTKQKC